MKTMKRVAGCLAAASMLAIPSTASADEVLANAENIRKLDIMLMVTSLRCRHGTDNFQADYQAFSAAHVTTLNRAGRHLQSGLARQHGDRGAKKALDRISVGMANQYGQGHPWLECSELRQVARDLAADRSPARLSSAATELLAEYPSRQGYARNDTAIAYDARF